MYHTGIDPFTKKPVHIARHLGDRNLQRALMQFFKPENWLTVREALFEAEGQVLTGNGFDCLIPANPPQAALENRLKQANDAVPGGHYDYVANPTRGEPTRERRAGPVMLTSYRPDRKSVKRRHRMKKGMPG